MLINLLPDFFTILDSTDPNAAYRTYFESHRRLLQAYWHNYVIDPDSPHFTDVVRSTVMADRGDLRAMLERTDVVALARDTEAKVRALLDVDADYDVVLMVGVGAANAGELVVGSRGIAFVCLEHFTGIANPTRRGWGSTRSSSPCGWRTSSLTSFVTRRRKAGASCGPSSPVMEATTPTGRPAGVRRFVSCW